MRTPILLVRRTGLSGTTLPLQHAGVIVCGNALRIDWNEVLPQEKEDEVYLFGNPPYLGARKQNKTQKLDLRKAVGDIKGISPLDYIAGWFVKATKYIKDSIVQYSFVTTNSINQGEQVSILWDQLYAESSTIIFVYKPFKWANNAKNNVGVIVSIIGIADKYYHKKQKKL